MAVVTYKVTPVILYDVVRESQEGDELIVIPVGRCACDKIALTVAWSMTNDEREDDDGDTIRDPVVEAKH